MRTVAERLGDERVCAGGRLSHVLHDGLRMAKEGQLYMWTSVLERVAEHVGGDLAGGIEIETRHAAMPWANAGSPPPGSDIRRILRTTCALTMRARLYLWPRT